MHRTRKLRRKFEMEFKRRPVGENWEQEGRAWYRQTTTKREELARN
jgi:hypothetical protein